MLFNVKRPSKSTYTSQTVKIKKRGRDLCRHIKSLKFVHNKNIAIPTKNRK